MDATAGSVPHVSSNGNSAAALSPTPPNTPEKPDSPQARLAYRLASEAIVDCCTEHTPEDGSGVWYMLTRRYDGARAQRDLGEEIGYLAQRGLLEWHPQSANLVRILELDAAVPMVRDAAGESLLRDANKLLDALWHSREFTLYIGDGAYADKVREWLTRYAAARLQRGFAVEEMPGCAPGVLASGGYGEPWSWIEEAAVCVLKRAAGDDVALLIVDEPLNVERLIARRIVACVNACAGRSTDSIEAEPRAERD